MPAESIVLTLKNDTTPALAIKWLSNSVEV